MKRIIVQALPAGPQKVTITLTGANHHPLEKGVITFVAPGK
jgi:hypothetical protein